MTRNAEGWLATPLKWLRLRADGEVTEDAEKRLHTEQRSNGGLTETDDRFPMPQGPPRR